MSEYRLAAGHITKTALLADDDYIVANFPRERADERWLVETTNLIDAGIRRVVALGGQVREYGVVALPDWRMILSWSQAKHLETSIFDSKPSALVTIYQRDVYTATWRAFQCRATKPRWSDNEVQNANDTWANAYIIRFSDATEI